MSSRANRQAIEFALDHPKAKQADVKQSFDNSFVEEAMKR